MTTTATLLVALVATAAATPKGLVLRAGTGNVTLGPDAGGAFKLSATCVDRSNWCGDWMDTNCTAGTNASTGARLCLGSATGPTIQAYSDGTMSFENLGNECVGIDESVPTATQLTQSGQISFGTTARVYKDSSGKLWLHAASLVDAVGTTLVQTAA